MKTAEEILSEVDQITDVNDSRTLFTYEQCLNAMKLYANAKLDEVAEKATGFLDQNDNPVVAKGTILVLKDKV